MNKVKMIRDVYSRVNGRKRFFSKGSCVSLEIAAWLPVDSYEAYEHKPVAPIPNEIKVSYDG